MKTYSITYNCKDKSKSKHNVPDEMIVSLPDNTYIDNDDSGIKRKYGFRISNKQLSLLTPLYLNNGKILEVYIVNLSNINNYDKNHHSPRFGSDNWALTTLASVKNFYGDTVHYLRIIDPNELSKAPQKLFVDRNELEKYYSNVLEKRVAKNKAEQDLLDNTNNGPLQFETPHLKVTAINKPTGHIPNVKVGDIIYGAIKVLDNNGKNMMKVSSKYVNYIKVYVNDEVVNTLPMSVFGDIMSKNFKFE